jgi:hypothetical protein
VGAVRGAYIVGMVKIDLPELRQAEIQRVEKGRRVHRIDGGVCTPLACGCAPGAPRRLEDPGREVQAGYGWLEITVELEDGGGDRGCPSVSIQAPDGSRIAEAETVGLPQAGSSTLANVAVATRILAPGTWRLILGTQQSPDASAEAVVVAGQGTAVKLVQPRQPPREVRGD